MTGYHAYAQINIGTDRHCNWQADRFTNRQTDWLTDREADWQTYTDGGTDKSICDFGSDLRFPKILRVHSHEHKLFKGK